MTPSPLEEADKELRKPIYGGLISPPVLQACAHNWEALNALAFAEANVIVCRCKKCFVLFLDCRRDDPQIANLLHLTTMPIDPNDALISMERRVAYAKHVMRSLRSIEIEKAICKHDPVHWISNWVYAHDPRETAAYVPFDPFPKQCQFIEWLIEREAERKSGLCEKSRDGGVTTLGAAYGAHGLLFREGFRMGFGSQKLEYVDHLGDPKSIFEKIRFILRQLPEWQLPKGWDPRKHDNFCRIMNPQLGGTLVGESGDDIGRGDRTSVYWLDEAAVVEHADMVEAALSQTTNVRIYVSTPRGPGNWFYRKRFGGALPVFTIAWTDDPRKDDEWLEKQKAELEPHVVAQELLLDYTASIEGIFVPALWVRAAVDLELPASGPVKAGMDIADEGSDKTVIVTGQGPMIDMPISWQGINTNQTAYKAIEECRAKGVTLVNYDAVGVGCIDGATLISGVPVADIRAPRLVRTLSGASVSTRGFRKGVADLYRVRTRSGRSVTVTEAHRFLTPAGWRPLSHLAIGWPIAVDDSDCDERRWGKPTSCWDRYLDDRCPYGGRAHYFSNDAASKASQPHEQAGIGLDLLRSFLLNGRPSTGCFWSLLVGLGTFAKVLLREAADALFPHNSQGAFQSLRWTRPNCRGAQPHPSATRVLDAILFSGERLTDEESRQRFLGINQSDARRRCGFGIETTCEEWRSHRALIDAEIAVRPLSSCQSLVEELSLRHGSNSWDDIQDVQWVRKGEFYDIHVPLWQNYEAGGIWHHNSGVKGVWQDMAMDDAKSDANYENIPANPKLPFLAVAIHGGTPASERYWPDGQTSAEKFQDVNGEMWWCLRQRFERTYEFVNATDEQRRDPIWQGQHRAEDLISIPDHPELIAEISTPLLVRNERGKIGRESKKNMKKRGIKSPNFADALCYYFNPFGEFTITGSPKEESVVSRAPKGTWGEADRVREDENGIGATILNMKF